MSRVRRIPPEVCRRPGLPLARWRCAHSTELAVIGIGLAVAAGALAFALAMTMAA